MDVVVDTSAIIAVIANEPEKERLIQQTRGFDLIAPESVHWEVGNAFSAMFKRKQTTWKQAVEAIAIYKKIPIRFIKVDLTISMEISHQLNIYAYDAYLVSCALKYDCSLISLDHKLLEASKRAGIITVEVEG
jgi:predicted nucleic acid-binding protein